MRNIPYGRQHIDNNDIKEVVRVLRSDWITQGSKVSEFEKELRELIEFIEDDYAIEASRWSMNDIPV